TTGGLRPPARHCNDNYHQTTPRVDADSTLLDNRQLERIQGFSTEQVLTPFISQARHGRARISGWRQWPYGKLRELQPSASWPTRPHLCWNEEGHFSDRVGLPRQRLPWLLSVFSASAAKHPYRYSHRRIWDRCQEPCDRR